VENPALITNAFECLRYEAPSPVNGRWVTADAKFQGQVVPKGSKLLLPNGSGNRDERHFPDPDRFDVGRSIDLHLSFGYGAHFCIGTALAGIEGQVALREVLRWFPTWEVNYEGVAIGAYLHGTGLRSATGRVVTLPSDPPCRRSAARSYPVAVSTLR